MIYSKLNINIKKAQVSDMPQVCALVKELADYERAPEEMWLNPADYEKHYENGHFECIVAEINSEIAGIMIYYPSYSTWKGPMLHLEDFIVSKEYRGKGIGKFLMDEFLSIAKKRKVNLVLWQVLDWNTPAINFYKKYDTLFDKDWWNVKMLLRTKPVNG